MPKQRGIHRRLLSPRRVRRPRQATVCITVLILVIAAIVLGAISYSSDSGFLLLSAITTLPIVGLVHSCQLGNHAKTKRAFMVAAALVLGPIVTGVSVIVYAVGEFGAPIVGTSEFPLDGCTRIIHKWSHTAHILTPRELVAHELVIHGIAIRLARHRVTGDRHVKLVQRDGRDLIMRYVEDLPVDRVDSFFWW